MYKDYQVIIIKYVWLNFSAQNTLKYIVGTWSEVSNVAFMYNINEIYIS